MVQKFRQGESCVNNSDQHTYKKGNGPEIAKGWET